MYSRHEEHSAPINASVERVFDQLDDHTRLSEHMGQRSWQMGWGRMDTVLDAQTHSTPSPHEQCVVLAVADSGTDSARHSSAAPMKTSARALGYGVIEWMQ